VSRLRFQISMSLDGYVAGPNQSEENPLGERGEELHEWALALEAWRKAHDREGGEVNPSSQVIDEMFDNVGAVVMGRKMFGPVRGSWGDESWKGWWGDDPPFHMPVFVLTHHARDPVPMEGGTTFHFVTDGIESALEQAQAAAGGKDVFISGGASAVQQYLKAGLVDEIGVTVVPLILGGGERLFDNLDGANLELELTRAIDAPGATHLTYRIVK
jgi:dihydrofolate reductase